MATQQILFAETIAGMKKAFKRRAYESDSDSEIDHFSNRGHKLKKRARFARKGQLIPATGPSAYKEELEYAGVRRSIIYKNPPLIDDDGYEVESGDEAERVEEAAITAAQLNPYATLRLEHILAPLTASTDLPSHPIYSKPFTSKTLTELVHQSCGIMRKENQSLWEVRHLWTALYGDNTWLPCEAMIGSEDAELYTKDHVAAHLLSLANAEGPSTGQVNGKASDKAEAKDEDVSMGEATEDKPAVDATNNEEASKADKADGAPDAELNAADNNDDDKDESNFVHPMFLPPTGAKPDRDLGLPEKEADDVRMLIALYVQKQEEVCRGTERLHEGLLRAERLRAEVLHWSKAEAHCGPNRDMSDGEDWYDKEEWGLVEDLKKGHDEEEEDTTTQGKTRRARR